MYRSCKHGVRAPSPVPLVLSDAYLPIGTNPHPPVQLYRTSHFLERRPIRVELVPLSGRRPPSVGGSEYLSLVWSPGLEDHLRNFQGLGSRIPGRVEEQQAHSKGWLCRWSIRVVYSGSTSEHWYDQSSERQHSKQPCVSVGSSHKEGKSEHVHPSRPQECTATLPFSRTPEGKHAPQPSRLPPTHLTFLLCKLHPSNRHTSLASVHGLQSLPRWSYPSYLATATPSALWTWTTCSAIPTCGTVSRAMGSR
jgi:hypothetical protein